MAQITTEDLSSANLISVGRQEIVVILNGDDGPGTTNQYVEVERYGTNVASDGNYTLWFINNTGAITLKSGDALRATGPASSSQQSGYIIGEWVNGALLGLIYYELPPGPESTSLYPDRATASWKQKVVNGWNSAPATIAAGEAAARARAAAAAAAAARVVAEQEARRRDYENRNSGMRGKTSGFDENRPIPQAGFNSAQNSYSAAFDKSTAATENYMASLQRVSNAIKGNFDETEGNDLTALFTAKYGSEPIPKLLNTLTRYRWWDSNSTPPNVAGYKYSNVEMYNEDGTTPQSFVDSLQTLRDLTEGSLRGWRIDPFDTAALFLVYLVELRDSREKYQAAMRDRLSKNLIALTTLALPFPEQFNNLDIELKSITSLQHPNGYNLAPEPHNDPRMWGTEYNSFMDINGYGEEKKFKSGPYATGNRSEWTGQAFSDRGSDKESMWMYGSQREGVDLITDLKLSHDGQLGYHINGLSFDMFFNLYRKALLFSGPASEDAARNRFWNTMNSYRYIVHPNDTFTATKIFLARVNSHTGAPINGGQLALAVELPPGQAIGQFVKAFPHVLPADAGIPSTGTFEVPAELSTWIARQDKSNYNWVVRINSSWLHSDQKMALISRNSGMLTNNWYKSPFPLPAVNGMVSKAYSHMTGREDMPEQFKEAMNPSGRSVTHVEVFAVPTRTIQSIAAATKTIPSRVLEAWEGAMSSWRQWAGSRSSAQVKPVLDSYSPANKQVGSYSNRNTTVANNYAYFGMGDLWLMVPTTNSTSAAKVDRTYHEKVAGIKKFIDYFSSSLWLGEDTYTGSQYAFGGAMGPVWSGGYGQSEFNNLRPSISEGNIIRIYKGAIDGVNDIGSVLSELKRAKAFEGMVEAPVFDFPDFTVKFQSTVLDNNTGQMVSTGDTFETPFAPDQNLGINVPSLIPVLSYERSTGFGSDMVKWLNRKDNGLNFKAIKIVELTTIPDIISKTSNQGGVSNKKMGTLSYQRIPVNTLGVSGRRYNTTNLLAHSTLPASRIIVPGVEMSQGEGLSATAAGGFIWAGILAFSALRGI